MAASVLALAGALLAMMVVPAFGADLHEPHVGTECDGTGVWHFVHNQVPEDAGPGELTAHFSSGTEVVTSYKDLKHVRHYSVTASGTLLGASDNIAEGKLVLSDYECTPKDTTTTTKGTSPTTKVTTTTKPDPKETTTTTKAEDPKDGTTTTTKAEDPKDEDPKDGTTTTTKAEDPKDEDPKDGTTTTTKAEDPKDEDPKDDGSSSTTEPKDDDKPVSKTYVRTDWK
jgi:hypothetical protein